MNIFLIFPDNNDSIEKFEILFNTSENCIFKIIIHDFAQVLKDYSSELPLITSNEVANIIVEQVLNQQKEILEKPDLILLHSSLNFGGLSNIIRKWENCEVYLITESIEDDI